MKSVMLFFLLFSVAGVYAQQKFQFTPEKPQAGDLIRITYEPAGDIANTLVPVEGVVYLQGSTDQADDMVLKKDGKKYTATVQTDTSHNFIYFSFTADKKTDNNFNDGYWIQLYDGEKIKKGSHLSLARFYNFNMAGVKENADKQFAFFEKELTLYPESKKTNLVQYARLLTSFKKAEAVPLIQKEIESLLKEGLKEETDYTNLEMLYIITKLPEQAKNISISRKEKFPNGKWTVNEVRNKFMLEKDPVKKEQLLNDISGKVESDENWKDVKPSLPYLKQEIANIYANKKDWVGFKNAVAKSGLTDKNQLASLYNNTAWEMQKTSENIQYAEEMSRFATMHAKAEWLKPAGIKPAYLPKKQWDKQREFAYAMYADTYAMVMYRMGEYKKGLPYTKDAALTIHKSNNPEQNNTYALLAEKALPVSEYKTELEQFVKDGKSTGGIKEILKRAYVKEKKTEDGFTDYVAALEKESYIKMLAELRKSMLNETAPSFALLDLDGKKVDISDLKGKVVVVDFWATWCGPCIASFPGMQKMVNKYKDKPDVRFVFIDTWEQGDKKEKNAGDFMTSKKYTFHVLMDNDNKVVEQFKVNGIPTKFIIDKEGMIRYKSVGYNGSDDKLISELTAMIEMAGNPAKNAL